MVETQSISKFSAPVFVQKQIWTGIKSNTINSDGLLIRSSDRYVAFQWDSDKQKHHPLTSDEPMIKDKYGMINDFNFLPFNDNYVATANGDKTIKVWNVPDDLSKLKDDVPRSVLYGHKKKINLIEFNPSAEGILASSSVDSTVKIWDVINSKEMYSLECKDSAYSLSWNMDGSLISSIWRDKQLRIIDPRQNSLIAEVQAHGGGKHQRVCFMGNNLNRLVSVGFSPQMTRELKVWDLRQMETQVTTQIDNAQSAMFPYFDSDLNMLWINGKGDAYNKYYEWINGSFQYYSNDHKTGAQVKSACYCPKTSLNVKKIEFASCYALTDKGIDHISVQQARKGDIFQDEFYPNCVYDFGQKGADWLSGNNAECKRRSMDPSVDNKKCPDAFRELEFSQMGVPDSYDGNALTKKNTDQVTNQVKSQLEKIEENASYKDKIESIEKLQLETEQQILAYKNQNEEQQKQLQALEEEKQQQMIRQEAYEKELKHKLQLQSECDRYLEYLKEIFNYTDVLTQGLSGINLEQKQQHEFELEQLLRLQLQNIEGIREEIQQFQSQN